MTKQKATKKLTALRAELARVAELNRRAIAAANSSHAQAQALKAQIAVVEELMGVKTRGHQ
jgi:hypothetical protein